MVIDCVRDCDCGNDHRARAISRQEMKRNLNIQVPEGSQVWHVEGKTYRTRESIAGLIVAPPADRGGEAFAKGAFVEAMLDEHKYINPVTVTAIPVDE